MFDNNAILDVSNALKRNLLRLFNFTKQIPI